MKLPSDWRQSGDAIAVHDESVAEGHFRNEYQGRKGRRRRSEKRLVRQSHLSYGFFIKKII